MKVYQKKNSSLGDETALVHLDRRHTLKEVTDEADLEDNVRKTTRANSLDPFEEGQPSTSAEVVTVEKKSNVVRKPTIITESELSSSRLYKDRKAKINSDDESIEDPSPTVAAENREYLEPRPLQNPNLLPIPVTNRRSRKVSTCCWYFTIVLVISIGTLAIMAGIGGIIYMEYFAPYINKEDIIDSTKIGEKRSDTKQHFQNNLHVNQIKIPHYILKEIFENSTAPPLDTEGLQTKGKVFHSKDSNKSKGKKVNKVKSSSVSETRETENEQPKPPEHSVISRNTHDQFNVPVSIEPAEAESNARNQDSLDLKTYKQRINDIISNIPFRNAFTNNISIEHASEIIKQIVAIEHKVDDNSNPETPVLISNEDSLAFERNFNFEEITTFQTLNIEDDKVSEDIALQNLSEVVHNEHPVNLSTNDNSFEMNSINNKLEGKSFDDMENSISDNLEHNSFDNKENLINDKVENRKHFITSKSKDKSPNLKENPNDHSPKNKSLNNAGHSTDDIPKDKSLNVGHSIDHSPKNKSLNNVGNPIDHNSENKSISNIERSIDHNLNDNSLDRFVDRGFEDISLDHTDHSSAKSLNFNNEDFSEVKSDENSFDERLQSVDRNQKSDEASFEERLQSVDQNQKSDETSSEERLQSVDQNQKSDETSSEEHLKSVDQNQKSDETSSEEHLQSVDQNQKSDDSSQLIFIRPAVESKAIPVPLTFLRRIGFDIKNLNSQQPMAAKDMDIKFSLAEALKYLRSLDGDNKLPTSRERNVTRELNNQAKNEKRKKPIITERKDYLDILRKKLFEEHM